MSVTQIEKWEKSQKDAYFIWETISSRFKSSRFNVDGHVMQSNGAQSTSTGKSTSKEAKVVLIVVTIRLQSWNR